jgi:integrase
MGSLYRPKYKDRHGQERESSVWWIQYYSRGQKTRESTKTTDYDDAKEFLKSKEGEAADRGPVFFTSKRITFAELAKDELNDYKINKRRSVKDLKTRLDCHVLPVFGPRKAIDIRPADVADYVVKRQNEGSANGTINRELTSIKRAFSLGVETGKIQFKPYIPMLKENNTRKGFFERPQFDTLLSKLTGHGRDYLRPMLRFAYITGWRIRSEVRKLQWRQVDFSAGIVRLEPGETKNDEGRTFPFTSELRAILEEQRQKADEMAKQGKICPWVFFHYGKRKNGKPSFSNGKPVGEFKHAWETACNAAGLPGRIPHDFRRTAVRNLVRAGIPERVSMTLTGHKTRSVFERYNIVSEGDLFEAARKLDVFADKDTDKDSGKQQNVKNLTIAK